MRGKKNSLQPNIFQYQEYQAFLRDWLAFRKTAKTGGSLRALAKQAGLAAGYLPMVLGGKRPLAGKALAKLLPHLGLNASEESFFEILVTLGTTESHEVRVSALERMKRFHLYQKHNPADTETYEYLTHWFYVAIREMAALPDFKPEAEWIQSRLKVQIPLKELKDALTFLTARGYLRTSPDGRILPPEKALECSHGVFRVALGKFHRETLDLASQSIDNTPSDQRNLQGHTFALRSENYEKATSILDEAMEKIRELGEKENHGDSIYHLEIALFPLTQKSSRSPKE